MYFSIPNWGRYKTEDEFYIAVLENNIKQVSKSLADGRNVNEIIELDEKEYITPIILAILKKNYQMIELLLEHKAKLDYKKVHAMYYAIEYGDIELIRYLSKFDVKLTGIKGNVAYQNAFYNYKHNMDELMEIYQLYDDIGLTIKDHAGYVFRKMIEEKRWYCEEKYDHIIDFLLEHGVNVNYDKDDYEKGSNDVTALYWAIGCDLELVKKLVKYGADITKETSYGKPYQEALRTKEYETANYLLSFEEDKTCYEREQKELASSIGLPEGFIQKIQPESFCIHAPKEEGYDYDTIEFLPLLCIYKFKIGGRREVIMLGTASGDYEVDLVWNPKNQKIGYWESEQGLYGEFGFYSDFIEKPFEYLDDIVNDIYLVKQYEIW